VLLPDAVRAEVARVAAPLRGLGDVKWVAPENYHLTLKFLGPVRRDVVEALSASLRRAAAEMRPFRLELARLGAFPTPARPQILWVGIDGGRELLEGLAKATEAASCAHGFPREERPYHGHLTLGRTHSPVGRPALADRLRTGDTGRIGTVDVEAIYLMRSTLLPRGPVYSIEARFPLGEEES
jgi:2'-5' RNA ligase